MLLNNVTESLLLPHELDEAILARLLRQLMQHRVDFGDLYFQSSYHESWRNNFV